METSSYVDVAEYIVDLYKLSSELQLEGVFYGDQQKIGRTPCICVEPGRQVDELRGAPMIFKHTFNIYILLYLARVQDNQTSRMEIDRLVEKVVAVLDSDRTLGQSPKNLVTQSWVISREPGYALRGGTLMNAVRIHWNGFSHPSP